MQTIAQKSVRSTAARGAAPARPSRSAVVVRASAESRRAVLGGLLAGVAFTAAKAADAAVTPVDLFDDRKAKETGFDLIYEARDLDLPQNTRDGMTQARSSLEDTKKRVKAAEARFDANMPPLVSKAYWTEAREELRRELGTLRFDLNTLASAKDKTARKAALALRTEFLAKVDALDLAIRKKDKEVAAKALGTAQGALDSVLAALL